MNQIIGPEIDRILAEAEQHCIAFVEWDGEDLPFISEELALDWLKTQLISFAKLLEDDKNNPKEV